MRRATHLELALRNISRDKRATPSQRLRACELLIDLHINPIHKPAKPNKIQRLANSLEKIGLSELSSTLISHDESTTYEESPESFKSLS
jgi:hypothetical protein